jgi:predicted component of type VI protein secretion system
LIFFMDLVATEKLLRWLVRRNTVLSNDLPATIAVPVQIDLVELAQDEPELAAALHSPKSFSQAQAIVRDAVGHQRVWLRPTSCLTFHPNVAAACDSACCFGAHVGVICGIVSALTSEVHAIHSRGFM